MIDVATLEKQALQLDPTERIQLADCLYMSVSRSVEPLPGEEWERVWKGECNKRLAELESGVVKAIPGEQVTREIRLRALERR